MSAEPTANHNATLDEYVKAMLTGTTLLKCGRKGAPHFRKFHLSDDLRYLVWSSPVKESQESLVKLKDVKEIRQGQNTAVFARNKIPEYEHLSFSLVYEERTLDLVCKEKKEFDCWFKGLRMLTVEGQVPEEDLRKLQLELAENKDASKERTENSTGDQKPPLRSASYSPTSSTEKLLVTFKGSATIVQKVEACNDIYTWGQGNNGRIGHGDENDQPLPKILEGLLSKEILSVTCGPAHCAAISNSGELFTWGTGANGRLGHGHDRDRFTPLIVVGLKGRFITTVACGESHTLALTVEGQLFAWGKGSDGRLGNGDTSNQLSPVQIPIESFGDHKVVYIAAGYANSACITADGSVFMWGNNERGQNGTADNTSSNVPKNICELAGKEIISIALASWHSLALSVSGKVFSWGNGSNGKLGHGDEMTYLKPKVLDSIASARIVSVCCGDFHSAILSDSGQVYTWGEGNYGQLGHGAAVSQYSTPLLLAKAFEGKKVTQIACGANHTAALTATGDLYIWGCSVNGRLGLGTEEDQPVPALVAFLKGKEIRQISCGSSHSAATVRHGWVPDEESSTCMACKSTFTFVKRRHHCRHCGGLFCGACSSKTFPLLKDGFTRPVRVCDECHSSLSKK